MRTVWHRWRVPIAGVAIVIGVVTVPFHAEAALTDTQIGRIISLLQTYKADEATVERVRAALLPPPLLPPFCGKFSGNLKIGDAGEAVHELQQALQRAGHTIVLTSVFDTQTAFAVKAFQEKYAAEVLVPYGLVRGTGYVGEGTRTVLKRIYGCSPIVSVASTVATTTPPASPDTATALVVERVRGIYDYTDDGVLDQTDTQVLLEVAVGSRECPEGLKCDLNRDGRVAASDALILANFIGSAVKAGQFDYTGDFRINREDINLLLKVVDGALPCPSTAQCDVNGDRKVTALDIETLIELVGS